MTELQTGNPLVVGQFTLIPIESLVFQTDKGREGCWLIAYKKPHAIIISGDEGSYVISMDAKEMTLEHLIQAVPELGNILASLRH